jgi:hypothetical protein
MSKMSETNLRLEYVERTWDMNFSDDLDDKLEDDYVNHASFYTDEVFSQFQLVSIIMQDSTPDEIINYVKTQLNT